MNRDTWHTPCEAYGVRLDPFPDTGTGKPTMIVCFACEPPMILCDACMKAHRECRTAGTPCLGDGA